jgi:acyl-CoA thioester hydrolase
MQVRVYYEDTDAGGIVYHSNYLNFCERARSEYFFKEGSVPLLEGGEFIVASLEAKFKAPARLGDLLDVKTEVISMKGSSLVLNQSVFKEDVLLFAMQIKLGFIQKGKIGRMSKDAQAYLKEIFYKEV